jgi:ParB family chromosome partitioning protein
VLAWQLALRTGLASHYGREDAPVEIRADVADVRKEGPDLAECKAQQAMEVHRQRWGDRLPGQAQSLLTWVLKAGDEDVLDLLAVCTASTLNAVQGRESPQPIADAIATAVSLDRAEFWQPTASYLGTVSKAKVLEAVSEAVSPEAARKLNGLKKDALVAQAQQYLDGKRWLPSVLRSKG